MRQTREAWAAGPGRSGLLAWPWPQNAGAGGTIDNVPELPEVESLAVFLRERAAGQVIDRADGAAISVLKTYQPDLTALRGRVIDGVQRHGKFLDLSAVPGDGQPPGGPLHLVMHLARAGWLRWRENLPAAPPTAGQGPARLPGPVRPTARGFDLTEAGTQKRLAVYLVADPAEVPGVAALGPDPLAGSFTVEALAALLAGPPDPDQGRAQRPEASSPASATPTPTRSCTRPGCPRSGWPRACPRTRSAALHTAIVSTLTEAVDRSAGWPRAT